MILENPVGFQTFPSKVPVAETTGNKDLNYGKISIMTVERYPIAKTLKRISDINVLDAVYAAETETGWHTIPQRR